MVAEINQRGRTLFQCEECGFFLYHGLSWAEKCEEHCKRFHSCNLEITSHTIKKIR